MRPQGQTARGEDGLQTRPQQHEGSRRHGRAGALLAGPGAHGDAAVRLGQGRGIVHAVAHEADHGALGLEIPDAGELVLGAQSCGHRFDAHGRRHLRRRLRAIAREQVEAKALLPELSQPRRHFRPPEETVAQHEHALQPGGVRQAHGDPVLIHLREGHPQERGAAQAPGERPRSRR